MSFSTGITTVAVVLILTLVTGPVMAGPAPAQSGDAEGAPAPLGAVVYQDPLTGPGLVSAYQCSSGLITRDFSDEGLVTRVRGRCSAGDTGAVGLSTPFAGLTVPDGEVRVEARALAGADRLSVRVAFRVQPDANAPHGYRAQVDPAAGAVAIIKQTADSTGPIARRTGVGRRLGSGEWASISVRFAGPRIWLFVDDALVLSATDDTFTTGEVGVSIARLGNPDDDAEAAAVVRNVRVAGLAEGEEGRLPRMAETAAVQSAPDVDQVILHAALIPPAVVPDRTCPTGLSGVEHVGEGLMIKTRGRCRPENTTAVIGELIRGLSVLDGEVAISFKLVSGSPRTAISLAARLRDSDSLIAYLNPSTGYADLTRFVNGEARILTRRNDVHRLARHGDWNRLAVRTRGAEAWLLLNDQALLYSDRAELGVGGVGISVSRSGSVDDDQESAVVFADLKVSALEEGDAARWPSFRSP